MRITTIAVIGTAFAAAAIVTVSHFDSRASERGAAATLATHTADGRQTNSFATTPIRPAENALADRVSAESIRTVDW